MSSLELSSMTVIELRKLAKEKHVRLGAGLSKDGIIQKLTAALAGESTEEATEQVVRKRLLPHQGRKPRNRPRRRKKLRLCRQRSRLPRRLLHGRNALRPPILRPPGTIPHHVTAPSLPIRLRLILRGLPGRREARPRHVPRPIRIPFG